MMVVWALRPTGVINFQKITTQFLLFATIIRFDCEKFTLISEGKVGTETDKPIK